MFKRFQKQWGIFRQSPPGKRFVAWHERSRKTTMGHGGGWRVLRLTGALICFVFTVIGSLVPGLPGVVFLLVGAVLLATESRTVARALDCCELKLRSQPAERKHS